MSTGPKRTGTTRLKLPLFANSEHQVLCWLFHTAYNHIPRHFWSMPDDVLSKIKADCPRCAPCLVNVSMQQPHQFHPAEYKQTVAILVYRKNVFSRFLITCDSLCSQCCHFTPLSSQSWYCLRSTISETFFYEEKNCCVHSRYQHPESAQPWRLYPRSATPSFLPFQMMPLNISQTTWKKKCIFTLFMILHSLQQLLTFKVFNPSALWHQEK